jgi:hypothetical protein
VTSGAGDVATEQRAPDQACDFSFLHPLVPTPLLVAYWRFAAERQNIFFRRLASVPAPWTSDPILQANKFTNAYRASDRVSQYLIRNVIYTGSSDCREVFFRTLLFKIFNRIETWELLLKSFGSVLYSEYSFRTYDRVLAAARERGVTVYSGAYIMPSAGKGGEGTPKYEMHLRLLERMMADGLPERITAMRSLGDCFYALREYPTIGDFLAYQYATDINYSMITDFSENEFVAAGPGARDGLRKCFSSTGGLNDSEAIRLVTERQDRCFEMTGAVFQSLWGRPLQLIDCQNLFCEFDKYARVAYPSARGRSGRTRIKQKYRPSLRLPDPWYPPKWGINADVEKTLRAIRSAHSNDTR